MSNNVVVLQGWLEIRNVFERVDGRLALRTHVDTGKPYLGGRHLVVLMGRGAELARAYFEAYGPCRIQVVLHGKLVTLWEGGQPSTHVAVRHVSFFGEPVPLSSSAYRPAGDGRA